MSDSDLRRLDTWFFNITEEGLDLKNTIYFASKSMLKKIPDSHENSMENKLCGHYMLWNATMQFCTSTCHSDGSQVELEYILT